MRDLAQGRVKDVFLSPPCSERTPSYDGSGFACAKRGRPWAQRVFPGLEVTDPGLQDDELPKGVSAQSKAGSCWLLPCAGARNLSVVLNFRWPRAPERP